MRAFFIASALLFLASVCHGMLIGSNPCTWGPAYWCQHVGTMKECGSTEYCPRRWVKLLTNPPDGAKSRDCLQCKMLIGQLRKLSQANFTQSAIGEASGRLCRLSPDSNLCRAVTDAYLPEVLQLVEFGLSDSQLCQALSLCGSGKRDPKLQSRRRNSTKAPTAAPRGSQCDDCVSTVNSVKKAIESDKTEEEISEMLKLTACSMVGPLKPVCDSLIDEFLPKLLKMLDDGVQPQQICSFFGFCSGSPTSDSRWRRLGQLVAMQRGRKPLKSMECLACKTLVSEARSLLRDNKTEVEIVEFVKNRVCELIPSAKDKCIRAVTEYSALIFQLLASELDPDTICAAFGACSDKPVGLKQLPPSLPRVGPQCIMCEFVIRELKQLVADNETEASIELAVKSVCAVMPSTIRQECNSFVDKYSPIIVNLIANELNPELLCSTIGLCANERVARQPLRSATACEICNTAVMYAEALLKEKATQEEVLNVIEKVCNFLPTAEQPQCRSFIEQYGAYVIQLLLQDLSPDVVCKTLGLCPSSLKRKILWNHTMEV